ncbi:IS5 family transposase [uncultured Pontibacter sp.]|uniref:IS5 family transposase n=1 Tax=uncultured Pontibacter sp. TaxID=453356 RepID=UPI0026174232|nr:IS5 family transposase [uncultured Pontibacter sp.]
MAALDEDTINRWIVPFLSKGKRRPRLHAAPSEIVSAILYRLKTGCQWRELPLKEFFQGQGLSWQGVYHHFQEWINDGSFRRAWVCLLKRHRRLVNLSSVQLGGSQTVCNNRGECIGYQARKAARTCNSLFLADDTGTLLACSCPAAGNHHDAFEIEQAFGELTQMLSEAGLAVEGLFLNADAGFDSQEFRSICSSYKVEANIAFNPRNGTMGEEYVYFDQQLYKRRNVVEQACAWLDSFKALLVRFETKASKWRALQLLALTVLFARKIKRWEKL